MYGENMGEIYASRGVHSTQICEFAEGARGTHGRGGCGAQPSVAFCARHLADGGVRSPTYSCGGGYEAERSMQLFSVAHARVEAQLTAQVEHLRIHARDDELIEHGTGRVRRLSASTRECRPPHTDPG